MQQDDEESPIKAPFPWFGGKSRAANLIWPRLGDVPNYVEPFAGSLAVLLARPHPAKLETVNDLDCMLVNFWRAAAAAPLRLTRLASSPIIEADLLARHEALVASETLAALIRLDPDYFNIRLAAWWLWGVSLWIGSGWGSPLSEPIEVKGIRRRTTMRKLPALSGSGSGMHSRRLSPLLPFLRRLKRRLERVRIVNGDWNRVLSPAVTTGNGITGVVLDPPYASKDRADVYKHDSNSVAAEVANWAIEHGKDKKLRIVVCGYEGDYDFPAGWSCVAWKAAGGYGNRSGRGNENRHRERLWFSPHCLKI